MFALGLIGCATYPPPEILPDKATNFKYQYSVAVPKGWVASEKLPKEYEDSVPHISKKKVSLVMVKRESKGVIIFVNDKRGQSYQKLMDYPVHKIKKIPQQIKEEFEVKFELSRFDSNVNFISLYKTDLNYKANPSSYQAEPLFQIEADMKTVLDELTLGSDWFAYPCHKNKTCLTTVFLIADLNYFDKNRPALDSVVESLTMHDVPTE